jgi:sugar phosphate isomerase/epimerase
MGSRIGRECMTGGFAIGVQAWSFHRFTAFEAIEKTAQAGGKVIELVPGQKLSGETGKAGLDHNSPPEIIAKAQAKLKACGVRAVNYGCCGLPNDEREVSRVFAFARKMGLHAVTSEPDPRAFDLIERLAKRFDVRVAIHNHPGNPKWPDYRYWDPKYVLSIVRNRDRRMGACADTGHWIRSGVDPLKALRMLKGRIVSCHLKDLHKAGPDGHDVPYGTGAGKVHAVLDELKRQKFAGNISIEYEHNWDNSVPEIAQCIGFVRGYGQK